MHCGHNIATGTIDAMTGGLRARECPLNLVSVLVSQYEPELFPGLIYRMKVPKVVLLIFVSGKVVLTGTAIPPSPLVLACAVHIALRVQGPWSLGDLGEAAGAAGVTGVCGGDVQAPRRRKRFTRRLRTSIRCWGSSARATRQRRPRSRQPCRCSRPLPPALLVGTVACASAGPQATFAWTRQDHTALPLNKAKPRQQLLFLWGGAEISGCRISAEHFPRGGTLITRRSSSTSHVTPPKGKAVAQH